MLDGNFNLYNNVKITLFNTKHEFKKEYTAHNKANATFIQGILKFIRGEFTPSNLATDIFQHDPQNAKSYIPSYISFGNGGFNFDPFENNVIKESYFDNSLQNELVSKEFKRLSLSKSEIGFNNSSDSGNLNLVTYVPAGYYTNMVSFNNTCYLTEVGLFANDFDGNLNTANRMLARVTFNEPIPQTKEDIILVQWNIGAVSVNPGWWTQNIANDTYTW